MDEALASGTKNGYHFAYTPISRSGAGITTYAIRASPVQEGVTGHLHYYLLEHGEPIRYDRNGSPILDRNGLPMLDIRYNPAREAGPNDPPVE